LPELAKIAFDNPPFAQQMQSLYQESWEPFCARMGERLPANFVQTGKQIGKHLASIHGQLQNSPQTLLHRDFQLGNVMFAPAGANHPPIFIDWQLMSVGRGPQDVAYFLSSNVTLEERRRVENDLLDIYFTVLKENGILDYPFEQCLIDYRLALCKAFGDIVVSSARANLSEAQANLTYGIIAPRQIAAILDQDAGSLLPS